MGTEILKSFGTLQSELEQAKSSLKGVDENIKRLIGRDPSEIATGQRHAHKRQLSANAEESGNKQRRGLGANRRVYTHDDGEPPTKRRGGVFNRLSDRVVNDKVAYHEDDNGDFKGHRQMISKVIVTPKEVPSRQDALDAQSGDEKFKARNRRMFGALLGTLQKFQQEETKLKPKEEKRAQLEKKIEETENREKAEIKKEKHELFLNRKKKQAEIRMIELKMQKMKTYAEWEELQKSRIYFIQTKTKPSIYYLPKKMNEKTKVLLAESKKCIEKMIEERKEEVMAELKVIEDKMQWKIKNKQDTEIESDKESDAENDDEEQKENKSSSHDDDKMEVDNIPVKLEEGEIAIKVESEMNTEKDDSQCEINSPSMGDASDNPEHD